MHGSEGGSLALDSPCILIGFDLLEKGARILNEAEGYFVHLCTFMAMESNLHPLERALRVEIVPWISCRRGFA